jgi:hypothetical protein
MSGAVIAHDAGSIATSSAIAEREEERSVLYTIAVILLVMWLLGMVSGYTIGAFIHVLLVIAIVLFLVQIISGRSAVP